MESGKTLTTDSGAQVTDNHNSRTAGPGGLVLIEKLAHFDRERIPERVCGELLILGEISNSPHTRSRGAPNRLSGAGRN